MMIIKDFYTVRPHELEDGGILVCVLTCHVTVIDGHVMTRLYRCAYPAALEAHGIPQGTSLPDFGSEIAKTIFPVIGYLQDYLSDE